MKHLNKFALVAIAIISISSLKATIRTWTGATSTSWSTGSNWTGNTAPVSADTVIIPATVSSNRNPIFSSNVSIRRFVMNGLTVTQSGSRTFTTSGDIVINGGTFTAGDVVTCNNFTINGGTFNSSPNDLVVTNNLIVNNGLLNGGSGNVDAADIDINNGELRIQDNNLNPSNLLTIDGGLLTNTTTNTLDISGDFTFLSGTIDLNGANMNIQGLYYFTDGALQNPGSLITTRTLEIDYTGTHTLGISVRITTGMTFTSGVLISSNTFLVIFDNNATVSGVSNTSHVNGPVRKEMSTSTTPDFTFPIGNGTYYAPLSISSMSSRRNQDYFTATYFDAANSNANGTMGSGLNLVSKEEYWILDRAATSGTASTTAIVTLSYNTSRSGSITNAALLKVARWNGSQWADQGRATGSSSSNTSGNVISNGSISSFSPFTLGSSSNVNPLPITLLNFTAKAMSNAVAIDWTTTSEINNDYFTLEKSYNGTEWLSIAKIQGAGNSETLSQYAYTDNQPIFGVQFYRLKQTDINGDFTYSPIVSVKFDQTINSTLKLFPVPANNYLTITSNNDPMSDVTITITNALGQKVMVSESKGANHQIDLQQLESGIYYIELQTEGNILSAKFQKI